MNVALSIGRRHAVVGPHEDLHGLVERVYGAGLACHAARPVDRIRAPQSDLGPLLLVNGQLDQHHAGPIVGPPGQLGDGRVHCELHGGRVEVIDTEFRRQRVEIDQCPGLHLVSGGVPGLDPDEEEAVRCNRALLVGAVPEDDRGGYPSGGVDLPHWLVVPVEDRDRNLVRGLGDAGLEPDHQTVPDAVAVR